MNVFIYVGVLSGNKAADNTLSNSEKFAKSQRLAHKKEKHADVTKNYQHWNSLKTFEWFIKVLI